MTAQSAARHIGPKALANIVASLFAKAGCPPDIAAEVSDNLVDADMCGHASHGVRLIASYVERIRSGMVDKASRPFLAGRAGSVLRVDGNRAFGQIVGSFAVREGVKAAAEVGIAVVSTTRSSHLGRNGKWAELAAEAGCASIHFVNAPWAQSSVVAFGGRAPRMTSNPIVLGAPRANGEHVVVDFAVAETSVNSIKLAFESGQKLPTRCVVKEDGSLTDDPAFFVNAAARAVLPFGGFKGYALGIFADIFAGALTGGGCHTNAGDGTAINNMLSIFMSVAALGASPEYEPTIDALVRYIAETPPDESAQPILLPGDRARKLRARAEREGIELTASIIDSLRKAGRELRASDEVELALAAVGYGLSC
jgi:uncharacterized oxidoreductase